MYAQALRKQTFEKALRKGEPAGHKAGDPSEPAFVFQATLSRGIRAFCRLLSISTAGLCVLCDGFAEAEL